MIRIVDRRFDSKKKSAVNRQRFFRRFKAQIRKAVADAVTGRSIRDIDSGEKVSIPAKDLNEPQFEHDRKGRWETVYAGNDQFNAGDEVPRPMGGEGQGRGKGASDSGEMQDDFVFQLSREEFLNIFFDELELPNLVKTQLARITEHKTVRAGHTPTGVPANINIVRSLRGALGRRLALGSPYREQLRRAEDELEQLEAEGRADDDPELVALRERISVLREKIGAIPFIDSFDLRYNNRVKLPMPSTQAVMFCVMDVSGSMDEEKKQIAKRFFMLLYLFLKRSYDHIEIVFIRHHTAAAEVDEEDFFHSRESGGTVVSSALNLMSDIVKERYANGAWNVYGAQASDGDNWENDSPKCRQLLEEDILPYVQYFAYVEIRGGEPQNLWREYSKIAVAQTRFSMQQIESVSDIYPVFRELFKKKLA
ncbi:MAG: YeaH/YhbH family protein [Rhodocyclaceae bacterium]|nr:YeaH/YhbH family protein [Rhodocyclaceae bacterium]